MLTVGDIFKKEREQKGLTLIDIEKKIKVRKKFLEAIEKNKWSVFSSKIYIEGIIKNYSKALSLNPDKTLAFFRRDYEKTEEVKFKKRIASQYLTPQTKKIALVFLVIIFLFFFGYFLIQLKLFLSPPKITIISPKTTVFKREDRITIIGKTEKETTITIFGERVYQNKEGIFDYQFPLKPGKNILIIEAIGANGKKTTLTKEFFREQ
ncbi:MAG: helix-turn-helix domain-containing protein [Microgenomates group bacterium]|nr:helix-turn-helix domain-containing protein [Microgenomates group bacterium]